MLKRLRLRNFKSAKELDLPLSRVNILIGEPDTGKSNILEALGVLSWCGQLKTVAPIVSLKEFVRFQIFANIFSDNCVREPVEIATEEPGRDWQCLTISSSGTGFSLSFVRFCLGDVFNLSPNRVPFKGMPGGIVDSGGSFVSAPALPQNMHYEPVKFYRFKALCHFSGICGDSLSPPDGKNLLALVMGSSRLSDLLDASFGALGQKFIPLPIKKTFEYSRPGPGPGVTFPCHVVSDTFSRSVFYSAAVRSNHDATIVIEEPEAHMYPSQIRALGEMIAKDSANQYVLATHSPYLFHELIAKTAPDQLAVYVTSCPDYRTRVNRLDDATLAGLNGTDPISDANRLVQERPQYA
jgi:hypothetical protein